MISAVVKGNKRNKKKTASTNFYKEYLQKLKHNVKKFG